MIKREDLLIRKLDLFNEEESTDAELQPLKMLSIETEPPTLQPNNEERNNYFKVNNQVSTAILKTP